MMKYEDGFNDGADTSATFLSILMGLAAFGVGISIFLAALIFFRWLF